MAAPIWQYIVIMFLFGLSFLLNFVSLGLMMFLGKVKPELLKFKKEAFSPVLLFVRLLISLFAMYLTYSLYVWAPGALSLGILIVHWTGLFARFISDLMEAGKEKTYTYGSHLFGCAYAAGTSIALVIYGVQCL